MNSCELYRKPYEVPTIEQLFSILSKIPSEKRYRELGLIYPRLIEQFHN